MEFVRLCLLNTPSDECPNTQSISSRLKKLGFERDIKKKTENKTWFTIDVDLVEDKCYVYGIKTKIAIVEHSHLSDTPPKANFSNFSNNFLTSKTEEEKSTEGIEEGKQTSGNTDLGVRKTEKSEKSEKVRKKRGYKKDSITIIPKNEEKERIERIEGGEPSSENSKSKVRKNGQKLEKNSLEIAIKSIITNATNHDQRGALLDALINRIANDSGYSKEEVAITLTVLVSLSHWLRLQRVTVNFANHTLK